MRIEYRDASILEARERHILHPCATIPAFTTRLGRALGDAFPTLERKQLVSAERDGLKPGDMIWVPAGRHVVVNAVVYTYNAHSRQHNLLYESVVKAFRSLEGNARGRRRIAAMHRILGPFEEVAILPFEDCAWETVLEIIEEESRTFQPVVYSRL